MCPLEGTFKGFPLNTRDNCWSCGPRPEGSEIKLNRLRDFEIFRFLQRFQDPREDF